jgi:hypothetical protein
VDSLGLFGHMEKRTVLSAVRFFWFLEDWKDFEFPSISCVHVYSLLDGFRVREAFLEHVLILMIEKHTSVWPTGACFHRKFEKLTSVWPTEACFHPKV